MLDFLSLFDTRTTIFLVSIAFFIQASAIGFQAYLIREYDGVRSALMGNFSLAVGFFLNIFQGTLPAVLTVVLSNFLLLQGPHLFYIAFSRFLGRTYNNKVYIFLSIAILTITIYFTYVTNSVVGRIVGASICTGTGILIAASKLWEARKRQYQLGVWLTFLPLTTYGIFLFVRAVGTYFNPPENAFSNTPIQNATYLLLFTISFLWTLGFILMVSQRLQSDLKDLASTDSLTRIPNRYAAQNFLDMEFARIHRVASEFSILLIDIDNFKQLNDKYGHAVGDQALIMTAQTFNSKIRKQDIVGRWGGEEFLMILPDTPLQNAKNLAERLRSDISEAEFMGTTKPIQLTISIGVSSSKGCVTTDEILKKADDALYVAKATKNATAVGR